MSSSRIASIWQMLTVHARSLQSYRLNDIMGMSRGAPEDFLLESLGFYIDFSRQYITSETLSLLETLIEAYELSDRMRSLCQGAYSGSSHTTSPLHALSRDPSRAGHSAHETLRHCNSERSARARAFYEGRCRSEQGTPLRTLLHLGTGGCLHGPQWLCHALAPDDHHRVAWVSSLDEQPFKEATRGMRAEETLCVIASKSWQTLETQKNFERSLQWFQEAGISASSALQHHCLSISSDTEAPRQQGIGQALFFPPEVGGRFATWSTMGFVVEALVGPEVFEAFLEGGRQMDAHATQTHGLKNLPALLACLDLWNRSFLGHPVGALLCYDPALRLFFPHAAQLWMESLGKPNPSHAPVTPFPPSASLIGGPETELQHSIHQALLQGSFIIPCELLLCDHAGTDPSVNAWRQAHAYAQVDALAFGGCTDPAKHPETILQGGRPVTLLRYSQMNAHRLGMLLALYEHKLFSLAQFWGMNPFDQPGVEYGKRRADEIFLRLMHNRDS